MKASHVHAQLRRESKLPKGTPGEQPPAAIWLASNSNVISSDAEFLELFSFSRIEISRESEKILENSRDLV